MESWGPNIVRLFCLSGHYSKPIDYTEDLLKENLVKWRQLETCYYELRLADGEGASDSITSSAFNAKQKFDEGIERMRTLLINRFVDVRDTRVNRLLNVPHGNV